MLLGAILLWALNVSVSRYMLTHGWKPLAYVTIRYFAATGLFWIFAFHRERTFRVRLSDAQLVGLAAVLIFLNQLGFVYSVRLTTASTVALILGTTPIFVGLIAAAVRLERMNSAFWLAAVLSFVGVGFVASGSGGFSSSVGGDALALATAATWAAYSVTIAPLMRRYSPFRISALVLAIGWIPLAIVGSPQTADQSFHFSTLVWICFGYAVVGPLFLTNILWFTAIDRVGPSRASLFANLQPFFAVVIALVLLSEHLNRWEIVGGAAIFTAILLERLRRPELRQSEADVAAEAPRP
jgi:drug/metabolite transporter (DMT)-like permease